jgi:WD40 repeat protein
MPTQYKTFRVFISSTFADMREERKILQKEVFPKLEKYCESKGARFQAVDLRWGVTEASQLEQKTIDICLGEVKRCQKISPKPNFLILLGDRYGWQPIPSKIPHFEMEEILLNVTAEEKDLLNRWYRLDENAIPAEFILQPREGEDIEYTIWENTEKILREIFRKSVTNLDFSIEQMNKYFCSATHLEILNGALNPPKDIDNPEKHVFAYSRNIIELPKNKDASDYLDFDGEKPDEYCKKQLDDLKRELKSKLKDNYNEYNAIWEDNESKIKYPNDFADNVYNDLFAIIDKQIKETKANDALEQEVQLHKEFKEKLTEHFIGREDIVEKMSFYINSQNATKTFVLLGKSGSGKSSVLAKVSDVFEKQNKNHFVIYRFLGLTATSSNLRGLLENLCKQIIREYNIDLDKVFEENSGYFDTDYMTALSRLFLKFLTYASPDKPLIILLDALDQLSALYELKNLFWLPRTLADNVKIIVTVLPEFESELQDCIIEHLPLLPQNNAEEILNRWLTSTNRKLTDKQQYEIINKFNQNGLPIFLKLAYEKAKEWKSYDAEYAIQDDVSGILNDLMDSLEKEHTKDFVTHIISYLLCGRYKGLTENELLEVLVFDKDYWEYKFLPQTHPVHREELADVSKIPIVVWSRLYLDLEPFITETDANGIPIISFFHRQLCEVLNKRYINEGSIKQYYHKKLSSYFQTQELYIDRKSRLPNLRKLTEQPFQQTLAEEWDNTINTLCNLDFIQAKSAAKLTIDLIEDFRRSLMLIPENLEKDQKEKARQFKLEKYTHDLIACAKGEISIDLFEIPKSVNPLTDKEIEEEIARKVNNPNRLDKLNDFMDFVVNESENLNEYASTITNLSSHLAWNYVSNGPIGDAANMVYPENYKNCILRNALTRPKWSPMQLIIAKQKEYILEPESITITPDGKTAVSANGAVCMVWDTETIRTTHILDGHTSTISSIDITPDGKKAITGSYDKSCIVWNLENGSILKKLIGHSYSVRSVSFLSNGKKAVSTSEDKKCIIWNIETGEALKTLYGHKNTVNSISVTADGKTAITASYDYTCLVWNLETGKIIKKLTSHYGGVRSVSITPNGKIAISGSEDKKCIIWNIETGEPIKKLIGHRDMVNSVDITADGKIAISTAVDNSIIVWNVEKGLPIRTIDIDTSEYNSAAITADGLKAILAPLNNRCVLIDIEKGKVINKKHAHSKKVSFLNVIPSTKKVVSTSFDNTCVVFDIESGQALNKIVIHDAYSYKIRSIAITPNGKIAVTACSDQNVIIWDIDTGKKLLNAHTSYGCWERIVVVTPDGERLMYLDGDEYIVISDIRTGKVLKTLHGHSLWVKNIIITKNGKEALSTSSDKTFIVWNLDTGKVLNKFSGHASSFFEIVVSPDEKLVVSADSKTCIIWSIETGKALNSFTIQYKHEPISMLFTPDGKKILAFTYHSGCIVWDIKTRKEISSFNSSAKHIPPKAISLDGKRLVLTKDNTCIVWDIEKGKKLAHFFTVCSLEIAVWTPFGICAGGSSGEVFFLEYRGGDEDKENAIVTIRQIWDSNKRLFQPPSTECTKCGHVFTPPESVLNAILKIRINSGLTSEQSPCLNLPDEAWEHPDLLSSCPNCNAKLKYNPFITGGD